MAARIWHGTTALLVFAALVVQVSVAMRVSATPPSVVTGRLVGTGLAGRLVRVISFFTVESNVLSGIVSAQLAVRPGRDGRCWRPLRLAALLGIIITGVVYSAVLAPLHEPLPGAETFVNALVHYVVPLMMIIGWLVFGPRPRSGPVTVLWALAFPVLWLAYTLVRGAIWHWYPYPFVDVTAYGYGRVALNCVGVTLLFALVAGLVTLADRRLPPRPASERLDTLGP